MAVIEKIRVKLGVFITVLIALALLSFILDPTTLQTAFSFMSSKNKVGEINGKSIDYVEFQKSVDYYTAINQMMTGSSVVNDEQNTAIQNMAWQSYLNEYLFLKNAKEAGILVGEDERVDLTVGDMVSPMIARSPIFADENGNFSADRVKEFINAMGQDNSGNIKMFWDYLQNTILDEQYYTKYNSLFTASNFMNPLMLSKRVEENNVTADVDFVMVPLGIANDSTITVSDAEISAYYNEHKNMFKQGASRDIDYIAFQVVPSEKDIKDANDDMVKVYDEFANADNLKNFITRNSDQKFDPYYYAKGELSTGSDVIDNFAFGADAEGVSEIVKVGDKFMAARVADVKKMSDSAFVQHILLAGADEAKADSLLDVVVSKKNTFSNVAMAYSADKNPNVVQAGDIGWLTQRMMIPGFEEVLTAAVNKPFILKTSYGTHIVNVSERTAAIEKKQVAILVKEATASKETFSDFYAKANDIATKSNGKYEDFKNACQEAGLYPLSAKRVAESSRNLGSYSNTKEVTRWAYEAKVGEVSPIITVDNEYFFVAALTGIHKEGYASVDEVRPSIEMTLKNQKLAEKKRAEVESKIKGCTTMEAVAEALGTTVSSREGVAFASMTQQGFDPAFIGAVAGAQEGVITGPVKGTIGVYVFQVKSRETGAFYTEDDAKMYDSQMAQYTLQTVLPMMMDKAEVKDNRARFY